MIIKSELKKKIILLLAAGVALSFSRTPRNHFKIIKTTVKAWKDIKRERLLRIVREFYKNRVVEYKENKEGIVEIKLTKDGQEKVLKYQIDEIKIKKPQKWDGKWRVVIFDIPEKRKKAREALRNKLRDLEFKELQKSVFISPYECEDEIDFINEVFRIRQNVLFMRVDSFTNQERFELKFNLC